MSRPAPDPDHVESVLLGAACGDALGVPYVWLAGVHGWPGLRADDLRALASRVVARGAQDAAARRVPDDPGARGPR